MIIKNKNQITLKTLIQHDELVVYVLRDQITQCVKVRAIDGKRTYIKDSLMGGVLSSTSYKTLKELKDNIIIAHF